MKITLPYPPSVNTLYATVRGRRVLSKEGRKFKAKCGLLLRAQRVKMLTGEVSLWVKIYRPQKRGDLSNRIKSLEDAMTGIVYADDSQVVFINAQRFDDAANPRAEVEVLEIVP